MRPWPALVVAVSVVTVLGCPHTPASPRPDGVAQPPAAGATSFDGILAAERAGKIDHDTALVSLLLAIYQPDRLPAALRSAAPPPPIEATALFFELAARFGSLSPELRGVARPFFLHPSDAASFWNRTRPKPGEADPFGPPSTGSCSESFRDDPKYPLRYWYCTESSASFLKLGDVITAIDGNSVLDKESRIMNGHSPALDGGETGSTGRVFDGGTPSIDVYLLPQGFEAAPRDSRHGYLSTPEQTGLTVPIIDGAPRIPSPTYVILNDSQSADDTAATLAHELFHTLQLTYPGSLDIDWWHEASATWVEDQVLPQSHRCFARQDGDDAQTLWFPVASAAARAVKPVDSLDGPLDFYAKDSSFQYSACLWPYYLTQVEARPTTIVGDVWAARTPGTSSLAAIAKQLPSTYRSFKGFALANWNRDVPEAKLYKNVDGSDVGPIFQARHQTPLVKLVSKPDAGSDSSVGIDVELQKTSVTYVDVTVSDFADARSAYVPQLEFDLSGIDYGTLSVQAIRMVQSSEGRPAYQYEDWQGLKTKQLCRNKPNENVSHVILIVANADLEKTVKGHIDVKAKAACEPDKGNFTYQSSVTVKHGQNAQCTKQRKQLDDGATGGGAVRKTTVDGTINYSKSVSSQWKLSVYQDVLNPMTKERTILYEIDSGNHLTLTGTGNIDEDSYFKIPALGESDNRTHLSLGNRADGTSCNGPAPAQGSTPYWPCAANYAPSPGLGVSGGERTGVAGSLRLKFPASGNPTYEIHWGPAEVAMQSTCDSNTTETGSNGTKTSSTHYNPAGNSMDTSATGRPPSSRPFNQKPSVYGAPGFDGMQNFWSGTFNGTQANGGDIDASATTTVNTCDHNAADLGMWSAPCDYSMGDHCDECSSSVSLKLHVHVDVPALASRAPTSTTPPPSDPCAALAVCCAAFPSVAASAAPGCLRAAEMKMPVVCTQALSAYRGKGLCP